MSKTLHITVANKVASYVQRDGEIVCGNSDYQIIFAFDDEWEGITDKTARFIWNGQYTDVDFTGDTCAVPTITNTTVLMVGVYAGELSTTTAAVIGCKRSVKCQPAAPSAENDGHYANEAKAAAERAEEAAERAEAAAVITEEEKQEMADQVCAEVAARFSFAYMGTAVPTANMGNEGDLYIVQSGATT